MKLKKRLLATFGLWKFGYTKIPLIFYVRPGVVEMDSRQCIIKIPLNRKTKNHLNSMYFGTMAIGADLAGGLMAMNTIQASGEKVALIFKDMKVDFLKRVEGDALFSCQDGEAISNLVKEAVTTGERVYLPVKITTTVPEKFGDEPVAEFTLTLSLKKK